MISYHTHLLSRCLPVPLTPICEFPSWQWNFPIRLSFHCLLPLSLILSISLAAHRSISPPFLSQFDGCSFASLDCYLLSYLSSCLHLLSFPFVLCPPFHSDLFSLQCPSLESDLWSLSTGRHGLFGDSWGMVSNQFSIRPTVWSTVPLSQVVLSVRTPLLRPWERAFVVGSSDELGKWVPKEAKIMERSGTDRYGITRITVGSIISSQEPMEVFTHRPIDSSPSTVSIFHRILSRGCHTRWEVLTYPSPYWLWLYSTVPWSLIPSGPSHSTLSIHRWECSAHPRSIHPNLLAHKNGKAAREAEDTFGAIGETYLIRSMIAFGRKYNLINVAFFLLMEC